MILCMAKTKTPTESTASPDKAALAAGKKALAKTDKKSMKDVGRDPETGKSIPHEYDERVAKRIEFYVGAGLDPDEIARMLDIRPGKLKDLYGRELEIGSNTTNMEVAQAMFDAAKSGDVSAGRFWLKARAGWKDGESATPLTSPLQIHIHD